jgi:hypothetical protein
MFRDEELRQKLEAFLLPLYQDLDGASRLDEAERIGDIAHQLFESKNDVESRELELLLAFHLIGNWLEKVGNISRTMLAVGGVQESELRRTASSIKRLDAPQTAAERAVAAAILIDRAGVRGLAERFAAARRAGESIADVARSALRDHELPDWLTADAGAELIRRREIRNAFCRQLLDET